MISHNSLRRNHSFSLEENQKNIYLKFLPCRHLDDLSINITCKTILLYIRIFHRFDPKIVANYMVYRAIKLCSFLLFVAKRSSDVFLALGRELDVEVQYFFTIEVTKLGSFPFVPSQYVMLPPVTEHVSLHSKSVCKNIARASGGCK